MIIRVEEREIIVSRYAPPLHSQAQIESRDTFQMIDWATRNAQHRFHGFSYAVFFESVEDAQLCYIAHASREP